MMHTLAITVVSLLSFTALTNAATLQLNNYCNTALWISDANPAIPAPPAFELPRRTAYVRSLEGVGSKYPLADDVHLEDVLMPSLR